jgi:hypothetical protein
MSEVACLYKPDKIISLDWLGLLMNIKEVYVIREKKRKVYIQLYRSKKDTSLQFLSALKPVDNFHLQLFLKDKSLHKASEAASAWLTVYKQVTAGIIISKISFYSVKQPIIYCKVSSY